MRRWVFASALFLAGSIASAACSVEPEKEGGRIAQPLEKNAAITAEEALAMARSEVDIRGLTYIESEIRVYWWDGSWWVVFVDDPTVTGGDFTVEVSADGKVIRIEPGL